MSCLSLLQPVRYVSYRGILSSGCGKGYLHARTVERQWQRYPVAPAEIDHEQAVK